MIHTENLSIFQVFVSEVSLVCMVEPLCSKCSCQFSLIHRVLVLNLEIVITRYWANASVGHTVIKSCIKSALE